MTLIGYWDMYLKMPDTGNTDGTGEYLTMIDPPLIDIRNTYNGSGLVMPGQGVGLSSSPWTANQALNIDFVIHGPDDYPCLYAYWINGATALAGNFEIGIYDMSDTLLVSTGSVAQSGTTVLQASSMAYDIPPGRYRLALSGSSNGRVMMSVVNQSNAIRQGLNSSMMTSGWPLPSTWTAGQLTVVDFPAIGISKVAL